MDEKLRTLYYTTLKGVANAKTLYARAKASGDEVLAQVTQARVAEFLSNQETNQRFRRVNPKPFFLPIIGRPWQYQADLVFFDRVAKKIPILIVIELTSRKAYARVMPNKEAATTAKAMKEIIDQIKQEGLDIKSVEHDWGSEFMTAFEAELTDNGIADIRFPRGEASKTTLGKINVFVRTFRMMLNRAVMNFGGDWRDYVQEVLDVYNGSVSSATKQTPDQVKTEDNMNYIRTLELKRNFPSRNKVDTFDVGMKVRRLIEYDIFKKRTLPKFSKEVYTIAERRPDAKGNSFTLKDDQGAYVMAANNKGEELLRPAVQLFRAWQLLPVNADRIQKPPEELRKPTQQLNEQEARATNAVNRELRRLDEVPVQEETPTQQMEAIDNRANAPRERRVAKPTEKAAQLEETEQFLKQATRKKKALSGEDDLVKIISHEYKAGKGKGKPILVFLVQWKDGSQSKAPLSQFETKDGYHPLIKAYMTKNEITA